MPPPVPTHLPLPSFHLLCLEERYITAFESAKKTYSLPPSISITYLAGRLSTLSDDVHFDAIISPANSYARMDGGFDDALSRAFSPEDDYYALTRVAQDAVYKEYRGFAPPGSCLLVSLADARLRENVWGCKWLAFCPTMKVPMRVEWDREVVYECVWMLLAAIDRHNRHIHETKCATAGSTPDRTDLDTLVEVIEEDGKEDRRIRSVLMAPLATGYGGWTAEKWAAQTVLAIKHFAEAVENERRWAVMGPVRIMGHVREVEKTHDL